MIPQLHPVHPHDPFPVFAGRQAGPHKPKLLPWILDCRRMILNSGHVDSQLSIYVYDTLTSLWKMIRNVYPSLHIQVEPPLWQKQIYRQNLASYKLIYFHSQLPLQEYASWHPLISPSISSTAASIKEVHLSDLGCLLSVMVVIMY